MKNFFRKVNSKIYLAHFLDPKYDDMHIKIEWNVQPLESAHVIFLTSNAELEKKIKMKAQMIT